ncbi:MAG: flagellar basal body P-ring formation chaperone FlgA [bacterium]
MPGSGELEREIHAQVKAYFLQNLALSESELLIEFSETKPEALEGILWDQVRVLPSARKIGKGRQLVKCGVFCQEQLQTSVSLQIRVRTFQHVIVNKERLGRHTVLKPAHLAISRRETTRIKERLYTNIRGVVGMRTKRILSPGEILTNTLIESQPVLAAGSPVKIHFQKGGIEITMPGIARQDGHPGQKIRVRCLETRKTFTAVVHDSQSVIVNF